MLDEYRDVINRYKDNPEMNYIRRVADNEILVNKLIELAIIRHLRDLREQDNPDFEYVYNVEIAKGLLNFAKLIPDVSSGRHFELADFQKFTLCMIDGWRTKDNSVRFKRVYFSMARSNGKTQLASIIALRDFLLGQPETSRMIAVVSNTNDQVLQLYKYIQLNWESLKQTKWFKQFATGVTSNQIEMRIDESNTRLIKSSAESKVGLDSKHITTAIFDEFHAQKSMEFTNTITSGQILIPNSRLIVISTAGVNPTVPMAEDYRRYSQGMLDGSINKEALFICYEQDDPEKEMWQPETWIKSNPLMEVKAVKESLTKGIKTERDTLAESGLTNEFIVKNMNNWRNAKKNSIFQPDDINKVIIDDFDINNRDVFIGMDFSIGNDDTAVAFVYPYTENGTNKFHVEQMSFIPTRVAGSIQSKMKQDGINYEQAEKDGYAIITTDRMGNINQDEVYHWMLNFIDKHNLNVKAVGYDAFNTANFVRSLEMYNTDWQLFPIRQGAKSLSEPTRFFINELISERVTMLDDEVMRTALTNAVLTDRDNLMLVDKNKNTQKIDIVDSIIDALYEGMFYFEDFTNAQDSKDKSPFAGMTNEQINNHFGTDFSF